MKINRVVDGQYSQVRLEDGKKVFLSVLPDRITASTMTLFIPTRKIWEFIFPFYIRTAVGPWETSKAVLQIVLRSIQDATDIAALRCILEGETSRALRQYVEQHGERARETAIEKVGMHALKHMVCPKDLLRIQTIIHEYGAVVEKVGQQTRQKYPAGVYPQSLLPHPKEVIRSCLEDGLRYVEDEKMRASMRWCLVYLEAFIDDAEANRRNSEILQTLHDDGTSATS